VTEIAMIPKNGIDCIKALYIGKRVKTWGAPMK
jgi:hypothetical protein